MLSELRPFVGLLRGRVPALLGLFALGLLGSAASLATPLVGKAFIDAVATRRDFGAVPSIALALVGLALLDLVLGSATRLLHTRLSSELLAALRERLFARCLGSPLEHVERFRLGDLLTRFGTDVPRVQGLLVDGLLGAAQNLLFLSVAACILFRLSAPLALWSFAGAGAALGLASAFRRPVEARTRVIRDVMADLSHFLSERLGALRPLRLHGTGEEEGVRLARLNARLTDRIVSFQLFDTAASGLPGLALTAALAWIYVLGGRLLESGIISLGTFVAFVLYQGKLFGPAQGLLGLVRSLQEARVSVERVAEVLTVGDSAPPCTAAEPEPDAAPGVERGAVELRGVSFAYPGKAPVFEGLSLTLRPGEKVALFGASGSGKSTLVQLLFGLRTPGAGEVRVGGGLGYAGAEPFLVHASAEENLRYGNPDAAPDAVARAAALARADAFLQALPQGYATVIGGRGLSLSDGQRQRIGLARLFLRAPDVLVLDEATSGLDLDTEARVRENLWAAFADRTVLVVSHRPVGLDAYDRVLYLREGRLEAVAPSELPRLLLNAPTPSDANAALWPQGDDHGPHPVH